MRRRLSACSPFVASMLRWQCPPPPTSAAKTQLSRPPLPITPRMWGFPRPWRFVDAPLTPSPLAETFSRWRLRTSVTWTTLVRALKAIWMSSWSILKLLVNFKTFQNSHYFSFVVVYPFLVPSFMFTPLSKFSYCNLHVLLVGCVMLLYSLIDQVMFLNVNFPLYHDGPHLLLLLIEKTSLYISFVTTSYLSFWACLVWEYVLFYSVFHFVFSLVIKPSHCFYFASCLQRPV